MKSAIHTVAVAVWVELPTGGAVEYDYAAGITDGPADGILSFTGYLSGHNEVYRRVIERRVYPSGGTGSWSSEARALPWNRWLERESKVPDELYWFTSIRPVFEVLDSGRL